MMKNDEWGAVAYLSKSKYGKNAEVDINSDSSYYTGGGSGNAYVTNVGQSTTGTVHGVYDMSGGAYEYVAAYVNNGNSSLSNGESLVNGDAVYETSVNGNSSNSSWYGDDSYFPDKNSPFFLRGAFYGAGTSGGVFYFDYEDGNSFNTYSFRPVLVVL